MDDKWAIFLEDDWLYFHRSWTGVCIYMLRLESIEDGYRIAEAWVNRESAQYKLTDDEYDVKLLRFLIDNFLLGKNTAFPLPPEMPENLPEGAFQHSFSGSGYYEEKK